MYSTNTLSDIKNSRVKKMYSFLLSFGCSSTLWLRSRWVLLKTKQNGEFSASTRPKISLFIPVFSNDHSALMNPSFSAFEETTSLRPQGLMREHGADAVSGAPYVS